MLLQVSSRTNTLPPCARTRYLCAAVSVFDAAPTEAIIKLERTKLKDFLSSNRRIYNDPGKLTLAETNPSMYFMRAGVDVRFSRNINIPSTPVTKSHAAVRASNAV